LALVLFLAFSYAFFVPVSFIFSWLNLCEAPVA